MRPSRAPLLLLSAALLWAGAARADDPYAAVRQEFLNAYNGASAFQPDTGADSAALHAYPLYAYLEAARLKRDLRTVADVGPVDLRTAEFVKRYGAEPVGRALRRAWLAELARRKAWATFYAQYADDGGDPGLHCDALQARIALNQTKGLDAAITEVWLSGRNQPAECDAAFAWLRANQLLPPSLVEQRARLALAGGNASLARSLARTLPDQTAAPLLQWADLIEQPAREIDRLIADPQRTVENAALQDGWTRLARADVDGALQRWQPLLDARKLDAAAASPYARALALGLAWSRRPEAMDWFPRIAAADLDDVAAEWQVRAALWAGDWTRTAQALAALPPTLRDLARWRYWAARSAEQQGNADAAHAAYTQLLPNDNYYAALASLRLGQPFAPHPQPLAQSPVLLAQMARQPALERAHELLLCDLRLLAAPEWDAGYAALDATQRQQAPALAMQWGWYDQGIAYASKQRLFDDYALLYPRPYDAPVHAGAQLTQLPEDLIYAILRQESLYNNEVVSHAGAVGLMQMLPETAQRTARRWQRPPPAREQLSDPNVIVPLGSAELRDLFDLFGGQAPPAIAAYNAGPNAATRWLPDAPREAPVWIENIPYNETRDYVQRVLWHSLVFAWRRSGEPQKVDAWVAPVTVPTATPPAAPAPGAAPPG